MKFKSALEGEIYIIKLLSMWKYHSFQARSCKEPRDQKMKSTLFEAKILSRVLTHLRKAYRGVQSKFKVPLSKSLALTDLHPSISMLFSKVDNVVLIRAG